MRQFKLSANALLEFILVIPVFLILIAGLVETSMLIYDKMIVSDASREGARYGVMIRDGKYATPAEVEAYTATYCQGILISFGGSPSVKVTAAPSKSKPKSGDTLRVTVTYPFTGLLFYTNLGKKYDITASTVMAYE